MTPDQRHSRLVGRLAGAGCILLLLLLNACARQAAPRSPTATPARPSSPPVQRPLPPTLAALAAHDQHLRFEHLPPEAGLSQSVVLDFVQDDQGFLWMATQDGLNRYDGYQFRVFKEDPQATNSLKGSFVNNLDKAPDGSLWIATNNGGLNRYDPHTGQFSAFQHDPANPHSMSENSISALDVDRQGIVWAGANNSGLNRFDPHSGQATHYRHDPADPTSLSDDNVAVVLAGDDGQVWVGTTGGGLNRLDPATGRFTSYRYNRLDDRSLSDDVVTSLLLDRQGVLWVGTFGAGLNRFDAETETFTRFLSNPDDPGALAYESVSPIFEDREGRLWVGTQGGGVHLLDRQSGRFTRYQHDPLDTTSLAGNSVFSIFQDNAGVIWFGMFGAGADFYDPFKDRFLWLRSHPNASDGLSSDSIWDILQDDRGDLWIATNDGGLNRFEMASKTWQHFRYDPRRPRGLSNDAVYTVYQDRQGVLWFGTPSGLSRFDRESGDFINYRMSVVNAIYEDSKGNFWLGTAENLILFDRTAGTPRLQMRNDPADPASLSGNFVACIFEDNQGKLWIGTLTGGLNLMESLSGRFTRFTADPNDPTTLTSNTVLDIHQTQDGALWIATTGGLNRFDPAARTFSAYREKQGLPNDFVYGILEDDAGRLWLSTNRGLARFDPRTQTFKNFDRSDGLQGNEFNQWAFFENPEGVMFFGGVNGISIFHPDLVQDNPYLPPVVITGFDIYGQPVAVAPAGPLPGPVETTHAVQLSYRDDFFELTFAALDFSTSGQIEYAFMLEGLDRGWNRAGSRRFANYTNVPPGRYTFRVKASNSDGVWNEQDATLQIVIPPPFWGTTWFRLLVAAGLLSAVSSVFLLRIRAVEGQRRRLEQQVMERTHELRAAMTALEQSRDAAETANRAKSVFLANMSHEFRTPLNAILGFTQIMARDRRLPADHREDIETIHRSGEHLLGLINDVLDMSKIEAGRMRLNARSFDLTRLLQGLEEMFALRAEQKGLALRLELDPDAPRYVAADDGKLRQALMNLLGNAVKFTEHGQVVLRVQRTAPPEGQAPATGDWMRFRVEDTGPGIAADEIERIFLPFVQASSASATTEGTGLGLAISQQYVRLMGGEISVASQPGIGSVFEFAIPLEKVSAGDLEPLPPARRVIGLAPDQPAYRLLVVDDSEVNRKLLVKILTPVGFEVREASNGEEALAVWEAWAPHLIWLDMRMPVMDGYETTRRIKTTTRGMATVIVALTASALEEDKAIILAEGCDDYVRKPFHADELFEIMARRLGVRYLYEELQAPAAAAGGPGRQPLAEEAMLRARLTAADPAWLAELERAAILGDVGAIEHLAGQINAHSPELAGALVRLAGRFEHERILAALRRAPGTEHG